MMTNEQNDALITALKNVVAAIEALSAKIEKVEVKVEAVGQAVADNGFETRTALNAILDLVGKNNELQRSECAAREVLEKRREKNRDHMRKVRGSVCTQAKVKEDEKEKRDIPPIPPIESKEKVEENSLFTRAREETLTEKRERVTEEGFPKFWAAYPGFRKTKKTKTKQVFHARMMESKDPDALFDQMMKALEKWKLTRLWIADGGDFIMAPKEWLSNESWLDENIPPPKTEDGVDKARSEQRFVPMPKVTANIVLPPTAEELEAARNSI